MKKKSNPLLYFQGLVPVVIGLAAISFFVNNPILFGSLLAALLAATAVIYVWYQNNRKRQIITLRTQLKSAVMNHENALISSYRQSRSKDQFGNIDDRRWLNQIDTFLRTKVVPDQRNFSTWRKSDLGQQASDMVNRLTTEMVDAQRSTHSFAQVDALQLTPSGYEHFCADMLINEGWDVTVTKTSRDGGADFYADKDGFRLVAQCKRYSQPVGNKAVQEVVSALKLYNGNMACVVAPMGFTKQAQTEALCHQVHLLHHLELKSFSEKLTLN
jgi:restriction system protein